MDGPTAAQKILAIRNVPIVFLTSHTEQEMVSRVKEITRYGYIIKNSGEFVMMSSIEMAFELFDAHRKTLESEQRFEQMAASIDEVFWLYEADYRNFLYISPVFSRVWGFPESEVLTDPQKFIDSIYPEDLEKLFQANFRHKRDIEIRIVRADGSIRWIWLRAFPVRDSLSNSILYSGVATDITARKEMDLELLEKKAAMDASLDAIAISTLDGFLTYVNPSFLNYWALTSQEQIQGRSIFDFWEFRDQALVVVDALSDHGQWQGEMLARRSNGTRFLAQVSANTILDAKSGKPIAMVASFIDITEEKQIQRRLREREEYLTQLFNNMTNGVAVYRAVEGGEDFEFIDINEAGLSFSQLPRERIIGKKVTEVFPNVKEFGLFEIFQKVWRTGHPQTLPLKAYKDERIVQWVENYIFKLPSGLIVALYEDTSAKEKAKERLVRSEYHLNRAQKLAKVGNFEIHLQSRRVYASAEALRLYGLDAEGLSLESIQKVPLPQFRAYLDAALQNLIERDEIYDVVFEIHNDKENRNLSIHSVAEYDKERQIVFGTIQDISEQVEAQRQMHFASEILRNFPDAVMTLDSQARIISWQGSSENLFGYKEEDFNGRHVSILLSPDNREKLDLRIATALQERGVFQGRTTCRHKDGYDIAVETTARRLMDQEGRELAIIAINRDISERIKVEDLLATRVRVSEKSFSLNSHELMQLIVDEAERITNSNIGFLHFVNEEENDLLLQVWSTHTKEMMCSAYPELTHYPIARAGVWVDCVHERKAVVHNDYAALPHKKGLPDGHPPIVRELLVPIFRSGRIVTILGVGNKDHEYTDQDIRMVTELANMFWDLFERKEAMELVRQSEEQFRSMFVLHSVPMLLVESESGRIHNANEAAKAFYGYGEQLLSMRMEEINQLPPGQVRIHRQQVVRGEQLHFTFNHKLASGEIRFVEVHATSIHLGGEIFLFVIIHDISKRREAELKIQNLLAEKDLLLREVHHRIKNNMNNISAMLMIQAEMLSDERFREIVKEASNRIHSMMIIYDKLYKSADFRSINIRNYLEDLLFDIEQTYNADKKIEFRREIDDLVFDSRDATAIGMIVNELVTNVFKYAFSATLGRPPVIEIKLVRQENMMSLLVADNGVGLGDGVDLTRGHNFGLTLVTILAQQLQGKPIFAGNNGTSFRLDWSVPENQLR